MTAQQQTRRQPPTELPVLETNEFWTDRRLATVLSVILHGFSNLASNAIPPRTETVLETADKIEQHLLK